MIPARFSSVSDHTHTPLFSFAVFGLLVLVAAAIDCFFASYIGPFLATTLLLMVASLPNGVSALLLPYRRKSIFDASPALVKKKLGPVPIVSLGAGPDNLCDIAPCSCILESRRSRDVKRYARFRSSCGHRHCFNDFNSLLSDIKSNSEKIRC